MLCRWVTWIPGAANVRGTSSNPSGTHQAAIKCYLALSAAPGVAGRLETGWKEYIAGALAQRTGKMRASKMRVFQWKKRNGTK